MTNSMRRTTLRAAAMCVLMLATAGASVALKPTTLLADQLPPIDLENQIPRAFGSWRVDERTSARVINPQAETLLNKLYSQLLSRTYVDTRTGERIMLSIAYGANQSDAMQVHIPDVCYPAQGFEVLGSSFAQIDAGRSAFPVKRLITRMGTRVEPLTYWTTVGSAVAVTGGKRKVLQLRYGFRGLVPDGLIVRVSSIDSVVESAWAIQRQFAVALTAALATPTLERLVGGSTHVALVDRTVDALSLGAPVKQGNEVTNSDIDGLVQAPSATTEITVVGLSKRATMNLAMPTMPSSLTLNTVQTPPNSVLQYVRTTSGCSSGFVPDPTLLAQFPAAMPNAGGTIFSAAEQRRWQVRAQSGPFLKAGDYLPGSPGDWARINANAQKFRTAGERPVTESNRAAHGEFVRDAAFVVAVTGDAALAEQVRQYLVAMTARGENDFSKLCYRALDNSAPGGDAWFRQAVWTYRLAVTYDLVRNKIGADSRLKIENWLRLQAYFFAGQIDHDLMAPFPGRLLGDYSVRGFNAAVTTPDPFFAKRLDTNGDCRVDSSDAAPSQPIYAYLDADGNFGPRLSHLSQYYNNRRADLVDAFATVGLLINDHVLINRGKRYFMEWLTWAVYPDGSEGEFARAGEYCTNKAGLIYSQANIQAALHFAHRVRVVTGDIDLLAFATSDGAWGTETPVGGTAKSLSLVVQTAIKLADGSLRWYLPEPWKPAQQARPETLLARIASRFNNQGTPLDNFHELGLLVAADSLPRVGIRPFLMRDFSVTSLPMPGTTGNIVVTGMTPWSDAKGVIPGVYFWAAY